jgi:hypothetical protein
MYKRWGGSLLQKDVFTNWLKKAKPGDVFKKR